MRIGGVENFSFFDSAILIFFFNHPHEISQHFDDYPGFQPKTTPAQKYAIQCSHEKGLKMDKILKNAGKTKVYKLKLSLYSRLKKKLLTNY